MWSHACMHDCVPPAMPAQAREWYREDLVGAALAASGVTRESVFITSKLHPRHIGYQRTLDHFNTSLTGRAVGGH